MRLKDRRLAYDWLCEVADRGLTPDEAAHELSERLGRQPKVKITGTVISETDQELVIRLDDMTRFQPGQKVRLELLTIEQN